MRITNKGSLAGVYDDRIMIYSTAMTNYGIAIDLQAGDIWIIPMNIFAAFGSTDIAKSVNYDSLKPMIEAEAISKNHIQLNKWFSDDEIPKSKIAVNKVVMDNVNSEIGLANIIASIILASTEYVMGTGADIAVDLIRAVGQEQTSQIMMVTALILSISKKKSPKYDETNYINFADEVAAIMERE